MPHQKPLIKSRDVCFCGHPEYDHCMGVEGCKRPCTHDCDTNCKKYQKNPLRQIPNHVDDFDMYNDSQSKSIFRDTGYPGA